MSAADVPLCQCGPVLTHDSARGQHPACARGQRRSRGGDDGEIVYDQVLDKFRTRVNGAWTDMGGAVEAGRSHCRVLFP